MGNTNSTTIAGQTAPRTVHAKKSPPFIFGRASQRPVQVAPPNRKFGFSSSRKQRHGAVNTAPSNSMALRRLKTMVSPNHKVATTNKRSKRSTVGGLVKKLAPAAATAAGVSAASRPQSRGFGFTRRRPTQAPINTKRGLFNRLQKARKY